MILINLFAGQEYKGRHTEEIVNIAGEGEGGMN